MKHQEKKYRVDSFTKIQKVLDESDVKNGKKTATTHYYAPKKSNDVVKVVEYNDRSEIHILGESKGKYTLKEIIPVDNTTAGLRWLKDKGYKEVNVLKMVNTDYEYRNGLVGLYIIDDFLHSVILDFPAGQHESVEKEFGLDNAEVISIPYNKYLEKIVKLQTIKLI